MRLGIYAPYNRGEITAMALGLATAVTQHGWTVQWLAHGAPVDGVHPHWDPRVRSGSEPVRFRSWARAAEACVWFASPGDWSVLPANRKHVVVAHWDPLALPEPEAARGLTIVCPNSALLRWLESRLVLPLRQISWPAGLTRQERGGLRADGQVRALMVVDSWTLRHTGLHALNAVLALLAAVPTLRLAFYCGCTLAGHEKRLMAEAAAGGRMELIPHDAPDGPLPALFQADWLLDLRCRQLSGMLTRRAWACGVPVLAWAVEPLRQLIVDRTDGILVPCAPHPSGHIGEAALWNDEAVVNVAAAALSDRVLLERMQPVVYHRAAEVDPSTFVAAWENLLCPG